MEANMRAIPFLVSLVAAASLVATALAAPPQTAALIYTLQADKARLGDVEFDRAFQQTWEGKPFQDTGTLMDFEENRLLFGVDYYAPVATAHGEVRCTLTARDLYAALAARTGDKVSVTANLGRFTDRIELTQCKFKVLSPSPARPPAPTGIAAQEGATATPGKVTGKVFTDIARLQKDSDREALLNRIQSEPFADNGFASSTADGTFCRLYRSVQLKTGRVYCCLTARDLRPFTQFTQGQNVRIYGRVEQWNSGDSTIELSACRIERR